MSCETSSLASLRIGLLWKTKESPSTSRRGRSVSNQAQCVHSVLFSQQKEKELYKNVHVLSGHNVLAQASGKVFLLRNPEDQFLEALEECQQHVTGTVVCSSRSEAEISCIWGREWQQMLPLGERRCSEKAASKKDMDIQETFSVHLHILGEESWDFCISCSSNSVMLLWLLFNCGSCQETIGSQSRKVIEGGICRLAGKKVRSISLFLSLWDIVPIIYILNWYKLTCLHLRQQNVVLYSHFYITFNSLSINCSFLLLLLKTAANKDRHTFCDASALLFSVFKADILKNLLD